MVVDLLLPVQRIDNIKPPIHEKQKFCYFEISWFASFSLLEGGFTVPHPTRSTLGGCPHREKGVRGAGVQLGGDAGEDV